MAAARAAARAPGGARRGGSACLRPAPSSVTDGRRLWRGATELGSGGAAAWTRSSAEPASLGAAPPAPEHRAVTREGRRAPARQSLSLGDGVRPAGRVVRTRRYGRKGPFSYRAPKTVTEPSSAGRGRSWQLLRELEAMMPGCGARADGGSAVFRTRLPGRPGRACPGRARGGSVQEAAMGRRGGGGGRATGGGWSVARVRLVYLEEGTVGICSITKSTAGNSELWSQMTAQSVGRAAGMAAPRFCW